MKFDGPHAAMRFKERYGRKLTKEFIAYFKESIALGKSVQSVRVSKTRIIHVLPYDGEMVVVLYSNSSKGIVTFLPKTYNLLAKAAKVKKEKIDQP